MSDSSRLKSFFKGSAILVFSNICLKAINFFLLPLYTKNLTPEMLGISDTVTSFTGLLYPILVMGLDSAYSAFYFEEHTQKHFSKVFNSILFCLFLTGMIPVLMSLFAKPLSGMLFGTQDNYIVLILALLSVTLNLWFLPYTLELRMQNRMGIYGTITVTASLLMVLLNIYLVSVAKIGIYALVSSTVIVYVVKLLMLIVYTRKPFSFQLVDKGLLGKMLRFSVPLMPNTITMWILNLSDRYVLLYFWGEAAVGLYGVGSRFITVINLFISAISTAYTTFAFSNVENTEAKKQYACVLNLMYVILVGAAFVVSVFSKEIIHLMTAETYAEAYKPLRDMLFAQVIYGIYTIINYGIYFAKKSKYSLASTTAGAAVNLLLNIIFIPNYGIEAAAVTTLIGYIVMTVVGYYFSEKVYPCDYGIKRIIINLVLLYLIALVGENLEPAFKLLLVAVCAAGTLWMFRKRLWDIWSLIMNKSN